MGIMADQMNSPPEYEEPVIDDESLINTEDEAREDGGPDLVKEDSLLEGGVIDQAVDEIIAHEDDGTLDAEDENRFTPGPRRHHFWKKMWHLLTLPVRTSIGRWITFLFIVLSSTTVGVLPVARYWVLNKAGVRASTSITVVDAATQLPLPDVTVTIGAHSARTTTTGLVTVTQLRLGPTAVTVSRPGFATIQQKEVIGWGSNPLDAFALKATGARFTIQVHDYASGQAIGGAVATSGDASALSDQRGVITLVLGNTVSTNNSITITKDGYAANTITLTTSRQAVVVSLLPLRQVVFVSQTNGTYNLYKSSVDGSDRTVLLAGTGNEDGSATGLVTSQDGAYAALVSVRDAQRDSSGSSFETLNLVNIASGTTVVLAHAEHIQLLDWIGTHLIFEQVTDTGGVPNDSIVSYDYAANGRVQLVSVPKLNIAFTAQDIVYYAVASGGASNSKQAGLYAVNPDGSGQRTIYNQEILGALRTSYSTFELQTDNAWLTYESASGTPANSATPSDFTTRQYVDNANSTQSLWINQGTLMEHDAAGNKDNPIQTQAGTKYPFYWFGDNAVVYRVTSGSSSADYISSLQGGTPHKIADVTDTSGFVIGE